MAGIEVNTQLERATLTDSKDSSVSYSFYINPETIQWGYTLATTDKDTFGGKVTQVLNKHTDSIVVTGVAGVLANPNDPNSHRILSGREGLIELASKVEIFMDRARNNGSVTVFNVPNVCSYNVVITSFPKVGVEAKKRLYTFELTMKVVENNFDPDIVEITPDSPGYSDIVRQYQVQADEAQAGFDINGGWMIVAFRVYPEDEKGMLYGIYIREYNNYVVPYIGDLISIPPIEWCQQRYWEDNSVTPDDSWGNGDEEL